MSDLVAFKWKFNNFIQGEKCLTQLKLWIIVSMFYENERFLGIKEWKYYRKMSDLVAF